MSHVVGVDLQIKNLEAIKRACKELGLEFREGQKTFSWYGHWVNDYSRDDAAYKLGIDPKDYGKCEHAIKVPGSGYEIGLMKHKSGDGYAVVYDFWGSEGAKIKQAVGGQAADKLRQYYAANATEVEMQNLGYQTERQWEEDGSVNINVMVGENQTY